MTALERATSSTLRQFDYDQTLALVSAVETGQQLQALVNQKAQTKGAVLVNQTLALSEYPTVSPIYSLHQVLGRIEAREILTQQSSILSVGWSPDGQTLATGGADGSVKLWLNEDLDRLLARGCDWLKGYLIGTPVALQKLTICQTLELRRWAAPALVAEGQAQAADGQVEAAIVTLQTAKQWDSSLSFDPVAMANQIAADAKRQAEANQLLEQTNQLITDNQPLLALTKLREALALVPDLNVADTWNGICWFGSLNNQAEQVLAACDEAVRLEAFWGYIDSRGLARALTGDIQGAIEDFQIFVDSADSVEHIQRRQRWIDALKAGRNPFTPAELESLRNE